MRRDTRSALNDRGMALIGVLVLSALLMSLAVALALAVRSDQQLNGAFRSGVTGFYAAESGLNMGMGEYRNIFLDYNVPSGSDFNPRTVQVGDRTVTYKLSERVGNPQNIVIPSGEVFSGLNAIQYRYIVNSTARNASGDTEAGVGAEFLVGYIPLFQFVAFYKNDLEIAPGPNMLLNGRVHTNGNLYLNANNTLAVADNPTKGVYTVQVSAGRGLYRGRKDRSECTGHVNVDMLEDNVSPLGDLDPKELGCDGSVTRLATVSELAAWKGSIISNIGNIAIPEPDIIKPPTSVSNGGSGDPGVYWDKADLRLVLHTDALGPSLAPGAPPLNLIEVVSASGVQDATKTAALYAFMMDASWNDGETPGKGPSRMRGTMPIFYTDVPNAISGCGDGVWTCNNDQLDRYTPALPAARTTYNGNFAAEGAYAEAMGPGFGDTPATTLVASFDGDYRRGGFYNHREDKWMLLLNINVRDLILWNKENGEPFFATDDTSEGGIVIFATVAGPSSNSVHNNYGVRVFGSNDIPLPGGIDVSPDPTGITVASDQAMYAVGDYNRGTVNGGSARQPASLIADSINVLSERFWRSGIPNVCGFNCCQDRWCRDGQSAAGLDQSPRNAQITYINAAFLGGVDTTRGGDYNGGLENYPRFHEDWGATVLSYQGAYVSLGEAQHVDGDWCGTGGSNSSGCNIYNPPVRAWNFDPAYNNAANLPPLTPRFVYVQQVLFTEDFK